MTHWSRRSTFVNHLAVAQKAAGEAFCKCGHVWASRLAPSQNSWASCGIRVSIWLLFFLICCRCCRHVGSNTGRFKSMSLRNWIHRYNLWCVPRPQKKTMLLWRHTVFIRHFLADASAAKVCLRSFITFTRPVSLLKRLQVLFRQLLFLKTWSYVIFQFNIEKNKISSNTGQLSKVTQYPQRGNLMNVFTDMKQKVSACELEQVAAASGKRGGLSSQQTI